MKTISSLEKKNLSFFFQEKILTPYTDSWSFDIKFLFYQIIKNLGKNNIKILYWKTVSILNVFIKLLEKKFKTFGGNPGELTCFSDKKTNKTAKLIISKEETQLSHSFKFPSTKEFDISNESWLNKIQDWDPIEKKHSILDPHTTGLDFFKKNLTRNMVDDNTIPSTKNRVYQKINKNINNLKPKKKDPGTISKKNFNLQEKNSFRKSYFRIKLDKINLIWFKEKKKPTISLLHSHLPRISKVFDVKNKKIEIEILKTEKGITNLLRKHKVPQNIYNTKKKYLDGLFFSEKELIKKKIFFLKNYFKETTKLKTPVIFQNIQNGNLKHDIFEKDDIDQFIISRFNDFLKNKIIFKQFNPFGDIYIFFSK